jgi:hypothetical protein
MSARRVVGMAAIIGDAQSGRQAINDTCTHGCHSASLTLSAAAHDHRVRIGDTLSVVAFTVIMST